MDSTPPPTPPSWACWSKQDFPETGDDGTPAGTPMAPKPAQSDTILEQQRNAVEEKLLSDVLSDEAFRRHMPRIAGELDRIHQELEGLESHRRLDTDALREILLFAREVPNAYAGAPPGLKKQYLRFFFKEFVVKERRIAKVVLTDFFQALLRGSLVRTERNWLPSLDSNFILNLLVTLLSPSQLGDSGIFG